MRPSQALKKNLRLLLRSRETAVLIIAGPLLILLLIGFAFSNDTLEVRLVAYDPGPSPLADSILQSLAAKYRIDVLPSEVSCIEHVKLGTASLCIIFPPQFTVERNETKIVRFAVDPSRMNLAYQVLGQLNREFGVESAELSRDVAGDLLARLVNVRSIAETQERTTADIQSFETTILEHLAASAGKLEIGALNFTIIDLRALRGLSTGLAQDSDQLQRLALENVELARARLLRVRDLCTACENETLTYIDTALVELDAAREKARAAGLDAPDKLWLINQMIDNATRKTTILDEQYALLRATSEDVDARLGFALANATAMQRPILEVRGSLAFARDLLANATGYRAEAVASPITTEIEHVTSETSRITFLYPYVLMLIIMFMGLMLGSAIVVMNKTSPAAFRTLVAPTRDEFHILMAFVATILIMAGQVAIILFASTALVSVPLFENFGATVVLLLLATTLFSFLGMIIGSVSKSQEAAMLLALSLGSVLLFVSNLIIPIEGMSALAGQLARYNPYVLLSETLRRTMLFGTSLRELVVPILALLAVALFLFELIVIFQHRARRSAPPADVPVREVKPLLLRGRTVKNEYDLLATIDSMPREEFREIISGAENPIAQWVKEELGNRRLAKKMLTASKELMILRLDRHVRKAKKK